MALQAYVVVFSTVDVTDKNKTGIPSVEDIAEAFTDYLGIPSDVMVVNMWPVDIESITFDPAACRRCGKPCEEGRLFCDPCTGEIAVGTAKEE